MNKLIACMTIAGTLMLCASTQVAQDAKPVPVPNKVKPKENASQADRRMEGEQMLGSFKDQTRVVYAKHGAAPKTLTGDEPTGCRLLADELQGDYCKVWDKVYTVKDKPGSAAMICEDTKGGDGFAIMKFEWANGNAKISWYKSLDALIKGHDDVTIEDKTTSSGSDETAEAEEVLDPYALYKKLGRKWKHKSTTTIPGMDPFVSYMEYEIIEVTDKYCVQKMTMFDKDEKPMAGVRATETRIEFHEADDAEDADGEEVDLKKETMKVEAGEFECYVFEAGGGKSWSSIKYPGLLVKYESEQSEMELIEFTDGGDKSEAKPDKPAEDEGTEKSADMSDYWERYVSTFKKGRTWTYEMMGGIKVKHEVTEVTETKATVKTTTTMGGNAIGEPTENEYDLTTPEDDGNPDDSVEWVEKEVECKAGKFVCVSPGHGVWMMKKHPFIVVKSDAGMELVEFTE